MLAVRFDPQMEEELEQLTAATGLSKSLCVKDALSAYLSDCADSLLALAALERNEPRTSLESVRLELSLER